MSRVFEIPRKEKDVTAVPLINHNPVRREIWVMARTYKQDFNIDQTSTALCCPLRCPCSSFASLNALQSRERPANFHRLSTLTCKSIA